MAAAAVGIRAALQRMGCSAAAATAITDDQTYDSIELLEELDDEQVKTMCAAIWKPGGQVAGAGGVLAPDHGHQISARAEQNLKLMGYWLRHQRRISRTAAPGDITLATVRAIKRLYQFEKDYEEPDVDFEVDDRDWPRTIEALDEYLLSVLGVSGLPLAYVTRKDQEALPEGDEGPDEFDTLEDEMVKRGPHTAP